MNVTQDGNYEDIEVDRGDKNGEHRPVKLCDFKKETNSNFM
jgi:hypothetical protein